ncbi:MAG: hypothetical protein BIFFINMI_02383 [Phycisphaerae bacterium]|nr:hypothetical protein [Phycisphaerae bacterium]
MKKLLILVGLILITGMAGCQYAKVSETYQKTPVKASSQGEGQKTYRFVYHGKAYLLVKSENGYKAIEEVKE